MATARCPSGWRSSRWGGRLLGRRLRRGRRAADGRHPAPLLCLYAVPPAVVSAAMRLDVAVSASGEDALGRIVEAAAAAWRGPGRPRRALRLHLDVETGLGRAGGCRPARFGRRPPADQPRGPAGRRLVASPAGRRCAADGQAGGPVRSGSGRAGRGGRRNAAPSPRGERGLLGGAAPAYDAVRIGLAAYGIVPDDVPRRPPAPPRRPGSGRSCHCTPGRSVSPTCPAAPDQLRAVVPTSRPSRIARPARLWRRLPALTVEPAQALVRGVRVPLSSGTCDGRGHGRRHRCPRWAGDDRRRSSSSSGGQGPDRSRSKSWRDCAPPTRGNRSRPCPGDALGGPCRGGTGGGPDRRDVEGS
jgi:hypothetical protein